MASTNPGLPLRYEQIAGDDKEPFLSRHSSDEGDKRSSSDAESTLDTYTAQPRRRRWYRRLLWTTGFLLFITLYTVAILKYATSHGLCRRPRPETVISSPAQDAINWEAKVLDTAVIQKNVYNGEPSDDLDNAWNDLVSLSNIAIPSSALPPETFSIPLPSSPNLVWATLGVNHELHCLKRLRQALHPEYYFPNMTDTEKRLNLLHSRHCVDYLRQAAMCHGDVSLTTYYWKDDDRMPVANFGSAKACVNWEALEGWQRERVFEPKKKGWLVHPTLGPAFPDGMGSAIGIDEKLLNEDHS